MVTPAERINTRFGRPLNASAMKSCQIGAAATTPPSSWRPRLSNCCRKPIHTVVTRSGCEAGEPRVRPILSWCPFYQRWWRLKPAPAAVPGTPCHDILHHGDDLERAVGVGRRRSACRGRPAYRRWRFRVRAIRCRGRPSRALLTILAVAVLHAVDEARDDFASRPPRCRHRRRSRA